MQIYFTDRDPFICAKNLPDQLTYKILTEVAQLMSKFLWEQGVEAPMKKINQGKDFCEWIGQDYANWNWCYLYGLALNGEYKTAYNKDVNCKSFAAIQRCHEIHMDNTLPCPSMWFKSNSRHATTPPFIPIKNFDSSVFLDWEKYRVVTKYRHYLNWKVNKWKWEGKCKRLYSWTNRERPNFIEPEEYKWL